MDFLRLEVEAAQSYYADDSLFLTLGLHIYLIIMIKYLLLWSFPDEKA